MISKADLCLFGLETTDGQGEIGPARKRTEFMTSSWTVAEELQRTCDGKGHVHRPLLERRAKGAEVHPPELCRAICRGVSRQKLADETGQMSSAPMSRGQVLALISSAKWKDEVHEDDGGHDVGGSRPQDGRAILRGRDAEMGGGMGRCHGGRTRAPTSGTGEARRDGVLP